MWWSFFRDTVKGGGYTFGQHLSRPMGCDCEWLRHTLAIYTVFVSTYILL